MLIVVAAAAFFSVIVFLVAVVVVANVILVLNIKSIVVLCILFLKGILLNVCVCVGVFFLLLL